MLIKRIELTNWGPHAQFAEDFNCNVVGILGPNGKGKSNFLQAIDFGLNKNLNKRNKESYIRNYGQDNGAKSAVVKIVFIKNGKEGTITRTITKTGIKNELLWDGETFKSDAKVAEMMQTILGADRAAMANAVFVKQGDLANLVKGTPAERQAIFQKLMNMNFLDSREVDIQNKITKLRAGLVDLQPTLDSLLQRKEELSDRLIESEACMSSFRNYQPEIDILYELSGLVEQTRAAQWSFDTARGSLMQAKSRLQQLLHESEFESVEAVEQRYREFTEEYNELCNRVSQLKFIKTTKEEIAATEKLLAENMQQLSHVVEELGKCRVVDFVTAELNKAKQDKDLFLKRTSIQSSIDAQMVRVQNTMNEYTTVATEQSQYMAQRQEELEHVKEELQKHMHESTVLRLKQQLMSSVDTDNHTCPICGSERPVAAQDMLNDILSQVEANNAKLRDLTRSQGQLQEWITQTTAKSEQLLAQYTRECDALTKYQCQIGDLPELDNNVTIEELDAIMERCHEELKSREQLEYSQSTLSHGLKEPKERLERLKASIADQTDDDLEETMEKYAKAVEYYKQINQVHTAISDAAAAVKTNDTSLALASEKHKECLDAITAHRHYDKFIELLGEEHLTDSAIIRDKLNEFNELSADYRAAETIVRQCKGDITSTDEQIDNIRERILKDADRRRCINDLSRVKQLVCKNGIPLNYMNTVFRQITGLVQDLLARMQANFTVVPDPDHPLTFRFTRVDDVSGYEMDQDQLSGGQAIRLSLALLLACQQIILPDVGLLVLDEPSSHVDAEGVENLKELFLQITSIFRNSETQLIVVDHNTTLNAAFETTINL